jgi:hypothetical protein
MAQISSRRTADCFQLGDRGRAANLISLSALSFLCEAFLSRSGWIKADQISARDPEALFASQK